MVAARGVQVPQPGASSASPGRAECLGRHPTPGRRPARGQHRLGQSRPRGVPQPRLGRGVRVGRKVDHFPGDVSLSVVVFLVFFEKRG